MYFGMDRKLRYPPTGLTEESVIPQIPMHSPLRFTKGSQNFQDSQGFPFMIHNSGEARLQVTRGVCRKYALTLDQLWTRQSSRQKGTHCFTPEVGCTIGKPRKSYFH